mgnify:FL=1
MKNFDFALILTCTIDPGNMPNLVRKNIETRLNDYKKSLNFWINNKDVNKIIFIENSGSDLSYFRNLVKSENNKEIEILSTNSNNSYDKNLGKGYGQYLCLKEVFESSKIAQKTNYFINVTGRYCIKNFSLILKDIISNNTNIYINLSNNLKYANPSLFGGSKKFFTNYVLPETKKTNDSLNNIFENCVANATLKAISDGMSLSKIPLYADIQGFIGTNGKQYKQNVFKKIKLFFFRKLKIYFFNHKKY